MRLRFAVALLLTPLLLLGACSSDDDGGDAAGATTTTGADGTTTTSTTCAADDADPAELEALLADEVPAGFEAQADDVGETGPSDLAKAARDDGLDDATEVLTELEFRRGYQRLWLNEAGEQMILFVYEFCDEQGPAGYGERAAELLTTTSGFDEMEVTGIEGASGFAQENAEGAIVAVTAPTGGYHVQAVAFAPPGTAAVDELTTRAEVLLAAQLAALDPA